MLNKVLLIGNLGADPELRYTPGGTQVATFSIATSERWKGQDGKAQDCGLGQTGGDLRPVFAQGQPDLS